MSPIEERAREGARNLLAGVAQLCPGETVLVVAEPPGVGFYDDRLAPIVAAAAGAMGGQVQVIAPPLPAGPDVFPADVADAVAAADCTVFLSRLGSRARFLALPGRGRRITSYTLDLAHLAEGFGRAPYGLFVEVHDRLVARILAMRRYSISCANGTALKAELPAGGGTHVGPLTQFAGFNFPMMIFPPVTAASMNGRLALTLSLISTGIHAYEDSVLALPEPVLFDVEQGRITAISAADPALARRVEAHLDRVGRRFSCDARRIDSWHTGLNPTTFYPGDARANMERWGAVVFGSPRYTHFHMVGANPGEVCGQLFDATIAFDDEVFWDAGRFVFLDRPDMRDLAARHGADPALLQTRTDIGLV
ncbi:MAG: hypothetical protein ACOYOJ_05415 [Alsobacter sp.]